MAANNPDDEELFTYIRDDEWRFVPLIEMEEKKMTYRSLLSGDKNYLYFSELTFTYDPNKKSISIDFWDKPELFQLDLIIEFLLNSADVEELSINSPFVDISSENEAKFFKLFYHAINEYIKNLKHLYIKCADHSEYFDHAEEISNLLMSTDHDIESIEIYTNVAFNNGDVKLIVDGMMFKKTLKKLIIQSQFNVNEDCLPYFGDVVTDNQYLAELGIFWNYDNSFDLGNNIKSTHLMYLKSLYEKINYLYLYGLLNLTTTDKLIKFDYYQKGWLKYFGQDPDKVQLIFFDDYYNHEFVILKQKFENIHSKILEKIKKITNYRRTSAPAAGKMINDNQSRMVNMNKKHACCNFGYSDDDVLKSLKLYDKLKNILEQSRKIIIW